MLNSEDEKNYREYFRTTLYQLAKDQTILSDKEKFKIIVHFLDIIYKDGDFRHYYSDIYSIITSIDKDPSKGNLEILSQNISYIKDHLDDKLCENTKNSIRKLYDHANLDIARINYIKALQDRNLSREQEIISLQNKLNTKHEELSGSFEKMENDIKDLYANILTLMGIFVAVFAFIAVNSNITFELTQSNQADIFWGIVEINVFVAICIIVLLFTLKLFIIKPLKKGRRCF
ncbi:MAG TPA: hypothetical protein H9716_12325 [Candidatus Enterocloster faecavium]|uniref:Uncharacterized protein n=1 Tax=Candidatus Enterocloster faecavium TaxID=2838560 RepID=A0A9D2LA19_9FIRM|nr:hypothetical protein [Candidatus Enterocloster faecavium]